ncbi:MAG: alpha/beta fold hydrolase [Pseudohongiellaceae bacterium]
MGSPIETPAEQSLIYLNHERDIERPIIHFSHANGYGPLTYSRFLKPFQASHSVIASRHRPLWSPMPDPESTESWEHFSDDILCSLGSVKHPVSSVGHSMGSATIVMAAHRKPELFKHLVLIEPALVPPSYYSILKLFGKHVAHRVPLVSRTLSRVDCWESPEQVYAHFRPKAVFKNISDEGLWDYINHGTYSDKEGKQRLLYSREWEARCYVLAHNIWPMLESLELPVLVIRGENSKTFSAATLKKLQNRAPQHSYLEVAGAGHLLPFEYPDSLAESISAWLERVS